jgi:hypothetical protein
MDELWINIILPILIGPFFLTIKILYETHQNRINSVKLIKYNQMRDTIKEKLDLFYWPLYIRLLCIYQINHLIPELKILCNNYLSIEIDFNEDNNNIQKCGSNNYLDNYYNKNSESLRLKQNEYSKECRDIIKSYIYLCNPKDNLGSELINFINHINISTIIDNTKEIPHNISNLLSLIEKDVYYYQSIYDKLLECGPYNYNYK